MLPLVPATRLPHCPKEPMCACVVKYGVWSRCDPDQETLVPRESDRVSKRLRLIVHFGVRRLFLEHFGRY